MLWILINLTNADDGSECLLLLCQETISENNSFIDLSEDEIVNDLKNNKSLLLAELDLIMRRDMSCDR